MKTALILGSSMLVLAVLPSLAAGSKTEAITPNEMKWASLQGMPGVEQVLLLGDPTKSGPYVWRLKIPANTMVPPHTHPDDENITVMSGSFGIGEGEQADKSKGKVLPSGSFYYLPANTPHFAWTGPQEVVVQIHGIGPSGMTMLQPPAAGSSASPTEKR